MSTMVAALAGPSVKSGRTSWARFTNRLTASEWVSVSLSSASSLSGKLSGGTGNTCSPRKRSAARLVTSAWTPGQAASSSRMRGAAGQNLLEIVQHQHRGGPAAPRATRPAGLPRRAGRATARSSGAAAPGRARAPGRSSGCRGRIPRRARGQARGPGAFCRRRPGRVSVTRRVELTRCRTLLSSPARPTKLLRIIGKLGAQGWRRRLARRCRTPTLLTSTRETSCWPWCGDARPRSPACSRASASIVRRQSAGVRLRPRSGPASYVRNRPCCWHCWTSAASASAGGTRMPSPSGVRSRRCSSEWPPSPPG